MGRARVGRSVAKVGGVRRRTSRGNALVGVALLLSVAAATDAGAGDDAASPGRDGRFEKMFARVVPKLKEALPLVSRHDTLPEDTFLFGPDKESNRKKIAAILDQAVGVLDSSKVTNLREEIRTLQRKLGKAREKLAAARRKRVSAPSEESLGLLDKANPFLTTREAYDQRIKETNKRIDRLKKRLEKKKRRFAEALRSMGLEVDRAAVDSLLGSVSGDDFVRMTVVFENIKKVTEQLQTLTEKSGEALDPAKRYYGMYMVLVKTMDHTQKTFIQRVREKHIPKLKTFVSRAKKNIQQAKRLIETGKGRKKALRRNIQSNRTTRKAARLYIRYLQQQAERVARENKEVAKRLATAKNTYKTVKLSSDVATLIENGRKRFDKVMSLELPAFRAFENKRVREEVRRLTTKLEEGG